MSSRWSRQRREKRKYEEYFQGDAKPTTSLPNSSSEIVGPAQYTERTEGATANETSVMDESFEAPQINFFTCTSESSDSDDEACSEIENNLSLSAQSSLHEWAIKYQISHSALRELLGILNNHYDSMLPLDPRTLCKTPPNLSDKVKKNFWR